MSDYIEREKAKDAVLNIVGWEKIAKYVDEMSKHPSTKDIDYYDALIDAEDVIDDLPSADVAPVRHGYWLPMVAENKMTKDIRGARACSECGASYFSYYDVPDIEDVVPNYCPNCGAKMDGDGNEID